MPFLKLVLVAATMALVHCGNTGGSQTAATPLQPTPACDPVYGCLSTASTTACSTDTGSCVAVSSLQAEAISCQGFCPAGDVEVNGGCLPQNSCGPCAGNNNGTCSPATIYYGGRHGHSQLVNGKVFVAWDKDDDRGEIHNRRRDGAHRREPRQQD